MTDTAALIARLEGGETGWPINGEVFCALFPNEGYHFQPMSDKVRVEGWLVDRSHGQGFEGYNRKIRVEPYTNSLDAAVALALRRSPECIYEVSGGSYGNRAKFSPNYRTPHLLSEGEPATPAAALVAALLKGEW